MLMRDPAGNTKSYEQFFEFADLAKKIREKNFTNVSTERQVYFCYTSLSEIPKTLLHRYGVGQELDELQTLVHSHTRLLIDDANKRWAGSCASRCASPARSCRPIRRIRTCASPAAAPF